MFEKNCLHCKENLNNQGYVPYLFNRDFKCKSCQADHHFFYPEWLQYIAFLVIGFGGLSVFILAFNHILISFIVFSVIILLTMVAHPFALLVLGKKEIKPWLRRPSIVEIILLLAVIGMIYFKFRKTRENYKPILIATEFLISQATPLKMGTSTNKNLVLFSPKHSIS